MRASSTSQPIQPFVVDDSTTSPYASSSSSDSFPSGRTDKPPISHETFLKLHRLSALNPPPAGSEDEKVLKTELNELIHLMDLVKDVELPSYAEEEGGRDRMVRELLGQGVGEMVIDGSQEIAIDEGDDTKTTLKGAVLTGQKADKNGRDLLGYATRRRGDNYGFKTGSRE